MTLAEQYGHHLRNAAMYRREAEKKLDIRYHPACAIGDLAYARIHERKAAEIWARMTPEERPSVPAPAR